MANKPTVTSCPEAVLRNIAWYPDQGLSEAECGAVEAHAAVCEECRREVEMLRGGEVSLPAAPDGDALYARVLGQIEAEGSGSALAAPVVEADSAPQHRGRSTRKLALAAGVLLALGLGVVGGLLIQTDPRAVLYSTAAEPNAAAEAEVALDVIFRREATAEQINGALRAIRAEIIAGPSRLGVYRVRLTADADAPAAAKMLLANGTGVATFAEPVQR